MKISELKKHIKHSLSEDMNADRAATDAKKRAIDAEIKALQAKKAELSRPTTPSPLAEEDDKKISADKISKALTAIQKQLDQMVANFKSGEYTNEEYKVKRKELKEKRDKLNAALISFEENENKI